MNSHTIVDKYGKTIEKSINASPIPREKVQSLNQDHDKNSSNEELK